MRHLTDVCTVGREESLVPPRRTPRNRRALQGALLIRSLYSSHAPNIKYLQSVPQYSVDSDNQRELRLYAVSGYALSASQVLLSGICSAAMLHRATMPAGRECRTARTTEHSAMRRDEVSTLDTSPILTDGEIRETGNIPLTLLYSPIANDPLTRNLSPPPS